MPPSFYGLIHENLETNTPEKWIYNIPSPSFFRGYKLYNIPWPSFFRGYICYNPYFGGVKPSYFHGFFGVQGYKIYKVGPYERYKWSYDPYKWPKIIG